MITNGHQIISYIPFVGVGIYIITILLVKVVKRWWVKSLVILTCIFLIGIVYHSPFWILNIYSYEIKIEKFYPQKFVKKFEKQFNTHVVQTSCSGKGKCFLVPLRDYNKSMDSYLRESKKAK